MSVLLNLDTIKALGVGWRGVGERQGAAGGIGGLRDIPVGGGKGSSVLQGVSHSIL